MCDTTVQKLSSADIINHVQFLQRSTRRFSVEDVIKESKPSKKYLQRNSFTLSHSPLLVLSKKSNPFTPYDPSITSTETKSDFRFISLEDEHRRYYASKTPYSPPPQNYHLTSPPPNFKPISLQLLTRHGSRTLTKQVYELQTLEIWKLAKQKDMLTPFGEQLERDTELFTQANNQVGRGEITQLGRHEQMSMGIRLYQRLTSLFTPSSTIIVTTSERVRAIDSAHEFIKGLTKSQHQIQISYREPDRELLYFHKSCAEYIAFVDNDPRLKQVLTTLKRLEPTRRYARDVLRRIYKDEFVEILIKGNYWITGFENNDPIAKRTSDNEVDIVLFLYGMLMVAPAQSDVYVSRMLEKYFTREESQWFAYINDAQNFYVKGPSFKGSSVTSDMAKPLLLDFFSSIDACIQQPNNHPSAHLRFAHAETVIPFSTVLQIPDLTDRSADLEETYTYDNNPWRGEKVASMSGNIQWEVYQHETDHDRVLIRMLYNEREVRFKRECQPIADGSFFYDLNELKRAYSDVLMPPSSAIN